MLKSFPMPADRGGEWGFGRFLRRGVDKVYKNEMAKLFEMQKVLKLLRNYCKMGKVAVSC